MNNYPKEYRENLEWRRQILLRCRADHDYREKTKELFYRDVLFAFNAFYYTLDVRRRPHHNQPFCTYGYQDEVILNVWDTIQNASSTRTQDLFVEKSRDMGATWMILLIYHHLWLQPDGGFDFLLGSRIEDYVDKKGDRRTHFERLRYAHYKLPRWLWPQGFSKAKHDNFMRLINPETGASITGESNNAAFSTQGRYASILYDEFAKWMNTDTQAWESGGDATPCRIAISTPFGARGEYYALKSAVQIHKETLHWSKHPLKARGLYCQWPKPELADEVVDEDHWVGLRSPWYDTECLRRKPSEVSQELDIDYIGSGNPVFDGLAGKRVAMLLRSTRKPIKSLKLRFGTSVLDEIASPVDYEDYIEIFEEPDFTKSYIVSVDVAEGHEDGDFNVVKVICRETEAVVATYASQISEVELVVYIVAMTKMFTFEGREAPWWAVETNGPGLAVFDLLTEVDENGRGFDLPNPFMMPTFDVTKQTPSFRKGWWTSTSSRRKLVSKVKEWLLSAEGWCDPRCAGEMTTFVKIGNKPQAAPGCFDDEVMCLGIGLMVNELAPYEEWREQREPHETGLPEDPFKPKEDPNSLTLQERCLAHALQRRAERDMSRDDYDDYIASIFEPFEDL